MTDGAGVGGTARMQSTESKAMVRIAGKGMQHRANRALPLSRHGKFALLYNCSTLCTPPQGNAAQATTCMSGEHSMGSRGRHSLLIVSNVAAWEARLWICWNDSMQAHRPRHPCAPTQNCLVTAKFSAIPQQDAAPSHCSLSTMSASHASRCGVSSRPARRAASRSAGGG